ncbi:TonB-linked SusC/RagA family outer membrane protein [Chitinophaga skermanii]|uniref:TonB-linked SusC/RagA family outer membrane protein n=1 Tax=Chitinophaga skermanii TaxID=331697 RepID=A0A327R5H9_9BACT|nr:SusC/RagA family TonB-linked outer membrane protein [Chitinophaga skermanii]RAJ10954.1 TonB-linked SusC/RagA family outer membrane protein [Chitinophaga skermanii]
MPTRGCKIWRYMLMFSILWCTCTIQLAFAQHVPNRPISIRFQSETLDGAILELEQVSGVAFVFDAAKLKKYKIQQKSFVQSTVPRILELLLMQVPFTFKAEGEHMIIYAKPIPSPGVITGSVVNEQGEPIPGATIRAGRTPKGTVSGADGSFALPLDAGTYSLECSYLAYGSQRIEEVKVTAGKTNHVEFVLSEMSQQLGPVVVTALGINKLQKSLGYAVARIDQKEFNTISNPNILNSLSAKVPGMQIRSMSPDPGASSLVVIRGESSLNNNTQPLFVIDGIPIESRENVSGKVDYGNKISDLNPDDIAEITVLKGASAAALYGSRAGNGVVLITTKSGSGYQQGVGVTYSSSIMLDRAWQFPKFQNVYGAGKDLYAVETWGEAAWGPALNDGSKHTQWNSPRDENGELVPLDWKSYPNRVKDFFNTGKTFSNTVSVAGNNDHGHFRLSLSDVRNSGIIPNTDFRKDMINIGAAYRFHPAIQVQTNISYSNNASNNRYSGDRQGVINILYTTTPNVDTRKLRDYWKPGKTGVEQFSHVQDMYTGRPMVDNPYFIAYEQTNAYDRHRLNGNVQININLLPSLQLMLRTGMDQYAEQRESRKPFSAVHYVNGYYRIEDLFFREMNSDVLLTYEKQVSTHWSINANLGANRMDQERNSNGQAAEKLVMPGIYNIKNGSPGSITPSQDFYKKRVNSVYGTFQANYKSQWFIELTGRNDWSSTLPPRHSAYFYPSISTSLILTEVFNIPKTSALSFAKFRANWAQVGKDTDPYNLYNTYAYTSDWGNIKRVEMEAVLKNADLKPEISNSIEFGADVRLFKNRIGIDVTYYKSNNKNQIIPIPVASSSGNTMRMINAGNIQNQGIELQLNATPIQQKLQWQTTVNFTRNWDKIVALSPTIPNGEVYLSGGEWSKVLARVGGRMGDMYGEMWKTVPDGPYKGQPWLTASGEYQVNAEQYIQYGNYNPNFTVGFIQNLTYKNVHFSALVDWRQGGTFYSYTANNLQSDGRVEKTLFGRDEAHGGLEWTDQNGLVRHDGMLLYGYIQNPDGSFRLSDKVMGPEAYYGNYYWDYPSRNSYSATYVKLREIALGYTFMRPFKNIQQVGITFMARNLFSYTAAGEGYDPETSNKIADTRYNVGINTWTLPGTRSYGVKLDVNF